jgi:hypothetical protein
VYGKRFKYQNEMEIEGPVLEDPFKTATFSRKKRSPDFFDKIGQKVKELYEKAKKLLGIGQQQQDGQGAEDGQEGRDGKFSRLFLWRSMGSGKICGLVCHFELLSQQPSGYCIPT